MFEHVVHWVGKWLPSLLPKLVTDRPDLLLDHALAYAALAESEIECAKRLWIRRAVAGAVALASALAFVVLAGIAVMLCAIAQPYAEMIWVLYVVPGSMLVLALIATMIAMSKGEQSTTSISQQIKLDVETFRAAMQART